MRLLAGESLETTTNVVADDRHKLGWAERAERPMPFHLAGGVAELVPAIDLDEVLADLQATNVSLSQRAADEQP